jgi:chromosome segregation ATPase
MESDMQQLRGSLANPSGPSNIGDYQTQLSRHERRLDDLTRSMETHTARLDSTTHRAHTAHNRVFALGGLSDQCYRLQTMRDEDRAEIQRMRQRVYDLEAMMRNLRI